MAKKKKKKKVPCIAQATTKNGVHIRTLPYSTKDGSAYHWTYVLRAKDPKKRELIARGMEYAVRCGKISYSNESSKNAKLFDDTKPLGFDCRKLKKRSTTNCCNLVGVACRFAGIKTPRKSSARTLPETWYDTDEFKRFRYRHGKTALLRGDILDASHMPHVHTAGYLGKKAR